jgi:hypothetical protein
MSVRQSTTNLNGLPAARSSSLSLDACEIKAASAWNWSSLWVRISSSPSMKSTCRLVVGKCRTASRSARTICMICRSGLSAARSSVYSKNFGIVALKPRFDELVTSCLSWGSGSRLRLLSPSSGSVYTRGASARPRSSCSSDWTRNSSSTHAHTVGYKGSGKTAIVERARLLSERDPELFVSAAALDDFSLAEEEERRAA